MRRVLLISPHFPPDSSAAAHRVRLLAPHLPEFGWNPVVLTLSPSAYETKLDLELERMVPPGLEVVRARAWDVGWTRRVGIGDLGLRSWRPLRKAAGRLLASGGFDLLFITIYPSYTATLGPSLKREFSIPFVLDYQDPWVGAWGKTVGGGSHGKVDVKSRITRWLAQRLEPYTLKSVDAITAVSAGTYEPIVARHPEMAVIPRAEIPLGLEPADFDWLRTHPRPNKWFDPADGLCHFCFVGTLAPMGLETLRALFAAIALLRQRGSEVAARLRLHFFGTSAQSTGVLPERVKPVAVEYGLADIVTEVPERLPYLDALNLQIQASAILLLGSSEPHYTASRIFPVLLARRPVLALFHEGSSVITMLEAALKSPSARVVSYGRTDPPATRIKEIAEAIEQMTAIPRYRVEDLNLAVLETFSSRAMAGKLAAIFNQCVESSA
jgi:hypothetical protein